jgi:DNA-binding SARP family transcriptional activator
MAETYARVDGYEQAETLFRTARAIADEVRNVPITRAIVIGHAAMYVRQGRREEADELLHMIDTSLGAIETVIPTESIIRDAVDTFRRITRAVGAESLPSFDELIGSPVTQLNEVNPAPPPTPVSTSGSRIVVDLLGTFRVIRAGREVTMDEWKRKKARDVFKVLAVHHRRPVTTDEIVRHIWGDDVPVEACLPTLQNAVSAIRTALEPDLKPRQPSSYLAFRDGSYTLDLGADARVDVEIFKELLGLAYRTDAPDERRAILTQAVELYRGDLLPDDRFEPWTDFWRDEVRRMCSDAFDNLAAACFALGDAAAAKEAMRRAAAFED